MWRARSSRARLRIERGRQRYLVKKAGGFSAPRPLVFSGSERLVLQGIIAFLTGTDLDDVLHGGDEDLAVAVASGVEDLLGDADDALRRNLGNDELALDLWDEAGGDVRAAVDAVVFFDQIRFYLVSAEEILKDRNDFLRGKFQIRVEPSSFHLGAYKKYLASIKEESAAFKAHQEASFEAEKQRWHEQGLDTFVSEEPQAPAEEVTLPEGSDPVCATVPGSVWKILAKEGDTIKKGDTVAVLESMKMEIPVTAEESGVITALFLKTGEQVEAGQILAGIRKEGKQA